MPKEKVGINDSMSIKKKSEKDNVEEEVKVDESGETVRTFFFPDLGKSVEASSLKEAREKLKKDKK